MIAATSAKQQVECDHCGLKVRLRQDGTYSEHGWKRHGVFNRCEKSGKRYAFHMGEFRVIERDAKGVGTKWLAECRCGLGWTGAEYDEAEARWLAHKAAIKAGES